MDAQARQLFGLIENITYSFGMQSMEGRCCNENISHGEFRALQAAMHQTVCIMQDIARNAAVTKSGATRIAQRLEEKGLAVRQQDHKDGRVCCVVPTEEGRMLLNRVEDKLMSNIGEMLAAMDPAMREVLLISLRAFVQATTQQGAYESPQREACCTAEGSDVLRHG